MAPALITRDQRHYCLRIGDSELEPDRSWEVAFATVIFGMARHPVGNGLRVHTDLHVGADPIPTG
jgi:hypothetical protein